MNSPFKKGNDRGESLFLPPIIPHYIKKNDEYLQKLLSVYLRFNFKIKTLDYNFNV